MGDENYDALYIKFNDINVIAFIPSGAPSPFAPAFNCPGHGSDRLTGPLARGAATPILVPALARRPAARNRGEA
jgi:hypothetical protein